MSKEKDIVADILGRAERAVRDFIRQPEFRQLLTEIAQSGGGMEQRLADTLASQIQAQDKPVRQHWGRSEAYVPRRSPDRDDAQRRALEEVQKTGRVAEAGRQHGVPRSTLYRILEKKRS